MSRKKGKTPRRERQAGELSKRTKRRIKYRLFWEDDKHVMKMYSEEIEQAQEENFHENPEEEDDAPIDKALVDLEESFAHAPGAHCPGVYRPVCTETPFPLDDYKPGKKRFQSIIPFKTFCGPIGSLKHKQLPPDLKL